MPAHARLLVLIFTLTGFTLWSRPTDSLRVELRNGVKYIIHRVVKGENVALLSKRYHVEESDIFSANPLISADAKPNQIVLIPLNKSFYGDVKPAVIAPVVDGNLPLATALPPPTETMHEVVENNEITETENNNQQLPLQQPYINESNAISGKILRKEVIENDTFIIYQVGPESSVTEVAKKFNVPDNAIKDFNNLESIVLLKGQVIRILVGSKKYDTDEIAETNTQPLALKDKDNKKQEDENKQKQAMLAEKYPYTVINHKNKEAVSYMVLEYDNLNEIAEYFQTTPENIRKTNKLTTNKLTPGTNLIIEPGKEFFERNNEAAENKALQMADSRQQEKQHAIVPEEMRKEVTETKVVSKTASKSKNAGKTEELKTKTKDKDYTDSIKIEIIGTNVHVYNISDYRDAPQMPDEWAVKIIQENYKPVSTLSQNKGVGDRNTVHVVQKGETLESIAKQYGVRNTDIINWNKLNTFRVRVGQELIINQSRYELELFERNTVKQKNVSDVKEVESIVEEGLVYFNPKSKFIGVLHPSLPLGKTIKITNKENFLSTYARVTGRLPRYDDKHIIIEVDSRIASELKINNPTVKVRITYGKIEKLFD